MLFDDYQESRITLKSGITVTVKLNFDTAGQKIYYRQNDNLMEMTNCHLIDTIRVADRKFVWKDDRLCEFILHEGEVIYINWKFRESFVGKEGAMGLTTQGKAETYYVPGLNSTHSFESSARYRDNTEVYTRKNENTYYFSIGGTEFKVRRVNELYKAFPEYATSLKTWSKKHDIQMLNASDALQTIGYLFDCTRSDAE